MRFTFRGLAPFAAAVALVGLPCSSGVAHAQTAFLSEFMFNAPGGDNGREYFEIGSALPNQSLSGLSLVVIEAEGGAAGRGQISKIISLDPYSTGANGLLLWQDSATGRNPAPDPATILVTIDFNPDVQNGSQTYALVRGLTATEGFDFDTDNNGTVDVATPWVETLDLIGYIDGNNAADVAYLADPASNKFFRSSNTTENPYAYTLIGGEPNFAEIDNASPGAGPYAFTAYNTFGGRTPSVNSLTPGFANPNFVAVPDAGTLPLMGMGITLFAGAKTALRRRRRVA